MKRLLNRIMAMLAVAALPACLSIIGGPWSPANAGQKISGGSEAAGNASMVSVDPFQSIFIEAGLGPVPDPDVEVKDCPEGHYLENLSLGQLNLVGIILTTGKSRALFQEASGRGHILAEGMCLGPHYSRIVRIKNDLVVFEEKLKNVRGEVTVNKRVVRLRKRK